MRHRASGSRRFDDLFRDHRTAVLGFLVRRAPQPADAADLLAEVFLVAWRRPEAVPEGDRARLWLYGVAQNALANHRRGLRRRAVLATEIAAQLGRFYEAAPPDTSTDDLRDDVRAAIATLAVDDQTIVTLNAWEGLSSREIAETLGMNPSTVRVRLHRARQRLRQQLGLAAPESEMRTVGAS